MSYCGRVAVPVLVFAFIMSGCGVVVGIFPSEKCSERSVPVELAKDPDNSIGLTDIYYSTAGCTIVFDVKEFHVIVPDPNVDPRWTAIGGLDYEVRVEPEGPSGRLETGVLPDDGRVSVPTVTGNTAVMLTIYVPDPQSASGVYERRAIVYLEPPP